MKTHAIVPQVPAAPLRALTIFDHLPPRCRLELVTNDDSDPHLRAGELAVVDTTDTNPQHGELYLVRWSNGRASIQQVIAKRHHVDGETFTGFWTRCLNFEPCKASASVCFSRRSTADGPRQADEIKKALVGRVIGFYQALDGGGSN